MLKLEDLYDIAGWEWEDLFDGVTYPWEVLPKIEAYICRTLQPKNLGQLVGQPFIGVDVQIGAGTIIEHGAVIYGPTIIGENCVIRAGAYIRGWVLIGNQVVVGNSSEIKNAVVMDQTAIAHFNYVGDSILGFRSHLGAGAILSNLKIPVGEIVIQTLEGAFPTGLTKCGAFVGDDCEIGCNSVLNPGSIVGQGSTIYPLTSFRGVVGPQSIVKTKQRQETVIKQQR
ncbi:MAG: UDP-N-acetylglucosamine diphosphorylase [Patescibacteria group bacterium]